MNSIFSRVARLFAWLLPPRIFHFQPLSRPHPRGKRGKLKPHQLDKHRAMKAKAAKKRMRERREKGFRK